MRMNSSLRDQVGFFVSLALLGCSDNVPELGAIDSGCVAQVTGTYDSVLLARLDDSTLWVAPSGAQFARIDGPDGALLASDGAASGSSAYGAAVGCAVVSGGVWCFPLAGPLLDSSSLGAGVTAVTSDSARQVVTALGASAPPLSGVLQLAGGMNGAGATFCAVTSEGTAWCWGYNANGLQIQGDDTSYARPVLLDETTELSAAAEIRVGFDSVCARRGDGSVWCWGNDEYGQLGTLPAKGSAESLYPVQVTLPAAATRLTASPGNTHCAILEDTRVACWGRNEYAQSGAPSDQVSVGPTIVQTQLGGPAFSAVVDLAPDRGMRAVCANTENAGLWCWGDVLTGDPTGVGSPYPVQLATSPQGRISVPLSAYGAGDGKLIYINVNGRLVLGAGSMPSARQPPCP
jgi:Regulator of chromosome condensation (RCC1) repeat